MAPVLYGPSLPQCIIIIFIINRGLTEENTKLGIISPIDYFKAPIEDILSSWGLVICSLTLRYQTLLSPIPNWLSFAKLWNSDPQLVIMSQLGIFFVSSLMSLSSSFTALRPLHPEYCTPYHCG